MKCYLCDGPHAANDCDAPMIEERRRIFSTKGCTICLKPEAKHYPIECPILRKRKPV